MTSGFSESRAATMPWKVPGFLAAFDKSHVVRAWQDGAPVGAGRATTSHPCSAC